MPDPPRERETGKSAGGGGDEPGDLLGQWYKLAGVGMEFFVALLVPGAIGFWLDHVLNTRPWLMIGGGLFGFAVGLYLLIKAANKLL